MRKGKKSGKKHGRRRQRRKTRVEKKGSPRNNQGDFGRGRPGKDNEIAVAADTRAIPKQSKARVRLKSKVGSYAMRGKVGVRATDRNLSWTKDDVRDLGRKKEKNITIDSK